MLQLMKFGQNPLLCSKDMVQKSFLVKIWKCQSAGVMLKMRSRSPKSNVPIMCMCKFGQNPPICSGNRVQTRSYADADVDGIHTKNNMPLPPPVGGHNNAWFNRFKAKMDRFAVRPLRTALTSKCLAANDVEVNVTSFSWNSGENDLVMRVLLFDFYPSRGSDKGM